MIGDQGDGPKPTDRPNVGHILWISAKRASKNITAFAYPIRPHGNGLR